MRQTEAVTMEKQTTGNKGDMINITGRKSETEAVHGSQNSMDTH